MISPSSSLEEVFNECCSLQNNIKNLENYLLWCQQYIDQQQHYHDENNRVLLDFLKSIRPTFVEFEGIPNFKDLENKTFQDNENENNNNQNKQDEMEYQIEGRDDEINESDLELNIKKSISILKAKLDARQKELIALDAHIRNRQPSHEQKQSIQYRENKFTEQSKEQKDLMTNSIYSQQVNIHIQETQSPDSESNLNSIFRSSSIRRRYPQCRQCFIVLILLFILGGIGIFVYYFSSHL